MKLYLFIFYFFLVTGCSVTSHPQYQQTFFKKNVSDAQIQIIINKFRDSGIKNASVEKDTLGRIQLTGMYENEDEVTKAFQIADQTVGSENVSKIRPNNIKVYNWELEATKQFANYFHKLVIEYKLSASLEIDGKSKQINISNLGFDGNEQFAFNSDSPSPKAAEFYKKIAIQLANSAGSKKNLKKLLIVGHTDDIGDSKYNSNLSERRARTVGKIFSENGFDPKNIFFQGAGEYYPISSNQTEEGRSKNRRVEFTELPDEEALKFFATTRVPKTNFYRYGYSDNKVENLNLIDSKKIKSSEHRFSEINKADKKIKEITKDSNKDSNKTSPSVKKNENAITKIDFGGVAYSQAAASLRVGEVIPPKKAYFNFISHAQSNESFALRDCSFDRPRYLGEIKSLKDGVPIDYRATDYVKGLVGKAWYGTVNKHLVLLNGVYVLAESKHSPVLPTLLVYQNYQNDANQKPFIKEVSPVNTYAVSNGILYRIFPDKKSGLVCLDLLFSNDKTFISSNALILYNTEKGIYVAGFTPRVN